MANNLFNALGNNPQMLPNGMGNMQNMLNRFAQFRQSFHGDPQQQIQQLMNSGKITQQQYNQAVQIAQQMMRYIK